MCRDLVLKRVLNAERKTDNAVGSRYLLELELENTQGDIILLSKYFYALKDNNNKNPERPTLCSPKGFSWSPDTIVHVILAGQNLFTYNDSSFKATGHFFCQLGVNSHKAWPSFAYELTKINSNFFLVNNDTP